MSEGGKDIGPQHPEQPPVPEVKIPEPRAYEEIKIDLENLLNDPNPNPDKLRALRVERARLINKAKQTGIFVSLKGTIAEAQRDNGKDNFLGVESAIVGINTSRLEQEAAGLANWDPRFEGLIEEYRDGAIRNMNLAWFRTLEKNGQPTGQNVVSDIERRIAFLNWGSPPVGLEMMAESFLQYMLQMGIQTQQQGGRLPTRTSEEEFYERMGKQPLPTHIRAMFEHGRNAAQFIRRRDDEMLVTLDIRKPEDRWRYILRNLEAFNNVYGDYPQWIGVLWNWKGDATDAARHLKIEKDTDFADFENNLHASLAITVSARLLEKANADMGGYLDLICGGKVENSFQIQYKPYILHGDESKIATVLEHTEVNKYFQRLMKDAGLGWGERPFKEYKEIVEAVSTATLDGVRESKLVNFLRNKGMGGADWTWNGGFDGYVKELLAEEGVVNDDPERFEKWQAAKLACDIFFTTAYTRYEDRVTRRGKDYKDFALKPCGNWAGDPLTEVISPPNLPKNVKKIYENNPEIWEVLSSAFRPRDVVLLERSEGKIKKIRDENYGVPTENAMSLIKQVEAKSLVKKLIRPDATAQIPQLNRYHQALFSIIGDPIASNLPDISGKGFEGVVKSIGLMVQVYPLLGFDKDDATNLKIARQLGAALFARIILAKTLAFESEFKMGKLTTIKNIMDPSKESAPVKALSEFMATIWGPGEKSRQEGLIKMFESRYSLDFGGNLGAEESLARAKMLALGLGANPNLVPAILVGKALLQTGKILAETAGMK